MSMAGTLYVNGDSVSVGFGLDLKQIDTDRLSDVGIEAKARRYSYLISQSLGLVEWNNSLRGGSAASVVRRTVNDLSTIGTSWSGIAVIGMTNCVRSELRYDRRYVRMYFGKEDPEAYDYCNSFMFSNDVSTNSFRVTEYLQLCRMLSKHSYDMDFLAERWLQEVILLQSFFVSSGIPYLFLPILTPGLSRVALRHHKNLIAKINPKCFYRFDDALSGWSFVGECEALGFPMYEHHPLIEGHKYIAEKVLSYVDAQGIVPSLRQ